MIAVLRKAGGQSAAREPVHQPDVEGLPAGPAGRTVSGANRELRGRLRNPQSRKGGGGTGVDARGAGAAEADAQREEDEDSECDRKSKRLNSSHLVISY